MGTMIPLGSVLGWIFAIVGTILQAIILFMLLEDSGYCDDVKQGALLGFIAGFVILIAGTVLITIYWGGA